MIKLKRLVYNPATPGKSTSCHLVLENLSITYTYNLSEYKWYIKRSTLDSTRSPELAHCIIPVVSVHNTFMSESDAVSHHGYVAKVENLLLILIMHQGGRSSPTAQGSPVLRAHPSPAQHRRGQLGRTRLQSRTASARALADLFIGHRPIAHIRV